MSELEPLGEVSSVDLISCFINRAPRISQDKGSDILSRSIEVSDKCLIDCFLRVITLGVLFIEAERHRTILVRKLQEGVSSHNERPVIVEIFLTSKTSDLSESTLSRD